LLLNNRNKPMNVTELGLGGPETFVILLETENMYTGCGEENTFMGKTRWSEIRLLRQQI